MDDEETLTAYHEAGHATIGFVLGGAVESMQLGGESDHPGVRQFGDCRIAWKGVGSNLNTQCQREILTILAGPAAEMVYRGESFGIGEFAPWQQDWQMAWHLVGSLASEKAAKLKILGGVVMQLKEILGRDDCWPAVAALADALLAHEHLEEEEVSETLRFWIGRC